MGRSSRYILLLCLGAGLPSAPAGAQVYGFPGAVGVIDDGFGTLPPAAPPPPFLGPPPPFDEAAGDGVAVQQPRPCALVIQVGKGLRRRATTRVVYGRTPPCR